jgi:hypothetical protein
MIVTSDVANDTSHIGRRLLGTKHIGLILAALPISGRSRSLAPRVDHKRGGRGHQERRPGPSVPVAPFVGQRS